MGSDHDFKFEAVMLRRMLRYELCDTPENREQNRDWNNGYRTRQMEEWSIGTARRESEAKDAEIARLREALEVIAAHAEPTVAASWETLHLALERVGARARKALEAPQ
jgi:hypothetical protein